MIIYNSMIIWIAACGIFYSILNKNHKIATAENATNKIPIFVAIITFGYIIFWAGIRTDIADTRAYINMYETMTDSFSSIPGFWTADNKSPGFDTLAIIFKCIISDNYHYWLMFIAMISGFSVMYTVWKHSDDFFYSAFLFVVTTNFAWMLNGIRQFLVVSILFALSDWIIERKTWRYIAVVLLLSTIHFTALIMIPIYFIAREKPFGTKVVLFVIALFLAIIFLEPFVNMLELFLEETQYGGFSEQFANDDGVNPIRVLVAVIPSVIAFMSRKKINHINDRLFDLCINMSLISAGLYLLGVFTSGILFGRFPIYCELYNIILLPSLFKRCFSKNNTIIMYVLCTICFLMFYFLQMKGNYYISDLTGLISGTTQIDVLQ